MGRHKKVPANIKELIKQKSDWKSLIALLNKLAFGGFQYQNYNGQMITSQPSLEAIQILMQMAWGKPGAPTANEEVSDTQLREFVNFISNHKSLRHSQTKTNNSESVTDDTTDNQQILN